MTEGPHGRPGGASSARVRIVLAVVLVAVAAAYLLRPIRDPDFFWHLKTGDWIWEQRQLPASDPFSLAGAAVATTEARLVLTSSWLSQLLFHFAHSLAGMAGILLLRFAIAAALLFVLWKRLRRDPLVDTALLLVFAVTFFEKYPVERPQVLSFVFFGLLLLLLDGLKGAAGSGTAVGSPTSGLRGALAVSVLMLVWANVHSGFVLGQATIAVYVTTEGAKFAHRSLRPVSGEAYRLLAGAGVAGILVALVNPNTFHAWQVAFAPGQSQGPALLITEYASTVELLRYRRDYIVLVVWIIMALAAIALISQPRRIDITGAIIVAGSGYFAFRHVRYVAVFMIVALPVIGRFLSQGPRARLARPLVTAGALALVLYFARDALRGPERLRAKGVVDRTALPVEAADFIAASGLRGTIFNFYDWGGYLIWRLGPEIKVFVDGRNLDPAMNAQALVVTLGVEKSGQRQWRALLDKYAVDLVLTPLRYRGRPIALVERLRRDPDWVAVWSDEHSIVFRRTKPLRGNLPAPPESF